MANEVDTRAIAERHHVAAETVEALLAGLRITGGRQVQFSIPELGGMGQWMPGMVMVGKMGDSALKARVDALCSELAKLATTSPAKAESVEVKTMETASTSSAATAAGSQNGIGYRYHSDTNRLVIEQDGDRATYDTTGYHITGVAQAQSDATPGSLCFTTSDGKTVDLAHLKRVPE